jgi:7-keto-8-aminopelargonate synthetase-like enzyme
LAAINEFIKDDINKLKTENLYRRLRTVDNHNGSLILANKKIINFNSNDYLGLSSNQEIIKNTLRDFDEISQCSSRLVGGNNKNYRRIRRRFVKT